MNPYSTNLPAG